MPDWFGIIYVFGILFAFLIGLLMGWVAFGKTKDKNYYAGYNDGLDKAYNLRNLERQSPMLKSIPQR